MGVALPLLAVVILVAGIWYGWRYFSLKRALYCPSVGQIDRSQIMGLKEFQDAEKSLKEYEEELQKHFVSEARRLEPAKQTELFMKLKDQLDQRRVRISNPLLQRAEAAVALVAKAKGMTIILDKRIVVCGPEEITQDVIKKFQSAEKLSEPANVPQDNSGIGYFDQEVIRSLKPFLAVDVQLVRIYQDMEKDLKAQAAQVPQDRREELLKQYSERFEAQKNQMLKPLFKRVADTVEKTAREKGLKLVLDKEEVMYGGTNVTDDVVRGFLSGEEVRP
jgi:outer membrane protein